ncbi:anthrone oxygenase family protein [Streptomyces sp. JNUCC 64]
MTGGVFSVAETLTVAAALLCGLTGGALYAFSTFVMRALTALPPAQGIAAMQAVNRAAPRPSVMVALVGGAVMSAAVAVTTVLSWPGRDGVPLLAGAALYLCGTLGVTVRAHFPRNDALDVIAPEAPGSAAYWREWARAWTRWNHVRTAAALTASALFALALAS